MMAFVSWLVSLSIFFTDSFAWNQSCPERCICESRQSDGGAAYTVDCCRAQYRSLPWDLPSRTQVLLFANNRVGSVMEQEDILPSGLLRLDLSNNHIGSLDMPLLWTNLTALRTLALNNNRITALPAHGFATLENLLELELARNKISSIENETFDSLLNLRVLTLEGNRLFSLSHSWFVHLKNLERLILDGNQLELIRETSFQELNSLTDLSLSGNKISLVDKQAFRGLEQLHHLNLERNSLQEVPTKSFVLFKGLKSLSLDGNLFRRLGAGSFENIHVSELRVSYMVLMQAVEKEAFQSLPYLALLFLHDNRRLTYIDPGAFSDVPLLRVLDVHNSNLLAVPSKLAVSLPSLAELTLYPNPIHCDCNAHWIQGSALRHGNSSVSNCSVISFPQLDHLTCQTPVGLSGQLLMNVPLNHIPAQCPPTVLPFFNESQQLELGESVTYECHALGHPSPHIHWILANGKVMNNTSNYSRVRIKGTGSLTLLHVKASDFGTYTCVATNPLGYDSTSVVLQVHNKNIHILHKGIATNFITITWNGTDSTVLSSDYLILYRKQSSEQIYGRIPLRPYMRTYTITNLQPQTTYEFCMAYEHLGELIKLHCLDIRTKHAMYSMHGIHTLGSMAIFVALTTTVSFVGFVCLSVFLLKRYMRRQSYEDPAASRPAPCGAKVGQMSQIPLDNLYNPPSTPICTSRTSLISQSRA